MFAELFVRRPTLVFVLIAIFTLAGAYSMMTLVKQRFPTVDLPTISVTANYAGASTSEMRDAVVRPLEDAIAGAPNLSYITSSIQQGQATISVTFTIASDKNADIIEVQRRVQNAGSKLPTDLRSPTVSSFDPSQSTVVTLVASSTSLAPGDLSALITNQVVPRLEEVPGISNANPQGAVTPALVAAVDPVRLAAAGATVTDVLNAISKANNRAPGGYATASGKETTIDIRADITSPGSIADLLLYGGSGSNAAPSGLAAWSVSPRLLRVSDVATVSSGFEPPRSYAFFGGRSAINLTLTKATGASEVSSANAVIAALPALRAQFPQVTFTLGNVESVNTQEQLDGVEHTLLEGIALTAIVMLFFLKSWRNAVVVIVAIPTSLLVTLTVMKVYNFTLDTLSLCAMTLVIGILVDDSIVVLENIERHVGDGEDPKTASIKGPGEIGLAALVITLVIVAVFLPIAFLPGIVGKFLIGFALVVVVATLASLLISFSVTPALAGNWSLYSRWKAPAFIEAFDRGFERLTWWYTRRALPWALRHPKTIVAVCALSAVGSIALVPLGVVGFEFIPPVDRGELTVQLTLPPGTAISQTASSTRIVEHYIDTQVGDLARETAIAGGSTAQLGGVVMQGNVAEISITLRDDRKRSTTDWTTALLAALPPLVPGTGVTVIPSTGTSGGASQPISYVLRGAGGADPATDAVRVAAVLASVPGAQNVTNGAGAPAPQVEMQFDRAAARARNVDIGSAASAVRAAFGGTAVTQYNAPQGITDVEVIYPASDRSNVSAIASIAIRNNNGDVVHVGDFTHLRQTLAAPIITRQDRQTVVSIGSNIAPGYSQSGVQAAFEAKLRSFHFSPGVSLGTSAGGTGQDLIDTVTGMAFALTIAIVMVYLLMVALFNSYVTPAIILCTVPVAIVGALGALALTHKTLNLFSLIGIILLIALVAKNGILLVDFANHNRAKGMNKIAAILNSAHVRFRPIMMTTIAMIAGMFPLALAIEAGAEERQSLGIVIIGGLSSSLILTLLLIPVIYLWLAPKDRREDPAAPKVGEPNPGLGGHETGLRPATGSAS